MKRSRDVLQQAPLEGWRQELNTFVPRVQQVLRQTRVFEPSTEVIRKGKAGTPNEFGKMVKLQEAPIAHSLNHAITQLPNHPITQSPNSYGPMSSSGSMGAGVKQITSMMSATTASARRVRSNG